MFFYNFFHKKEKYPNRENKVKAGRHCLFMLFSSVQFSSVTQLRPPLCNPMDCSTPGLPVHHQPPEFTQTHVH